MDLWYVSWIYMQLSGSLYVACMQFICSFKTAYKLHVVLSKLHVVYMQFRKLQIYCIQITYKLHTNYTKIWIIV